MDKNPFLQSGEGTSSDHVTKGVDVAPSDINAGLRDQHSENPLTIAPNAPPSEIDEENLKSVSEVGNTRPLSEIDPEEFRPPQVGQQHNPPFNSSFVDSHRLELSELELAKQEAQKAKKYYEQTKSNYNKIWAEHNHKRRDETNPQAQYKHYYTNTNNDFMSEVAQRNENFRTHLSYDQVKELEDHLKENKIDFITFMRDKASCSNSDVTTRRKSTVMPHYRHVLPQKLEKDLKDPDARQEYVGGNHTQLFDMLAKAPFIANNVPGFVELVDKTSAAGNSSRLRQHFQQVKQNKNVQSQCILGEREMARVIEKLPLFDFDRVRNMSPTELKDKKNELGPNLREAIKRLDRLFPDVIKRNASKDEHFKFFNHLRNLQENFYLTENEVQDHVQAKFDFDVYNQILQMKRNKNSFEKAINDFITVNAAKTTDLDDELNWFTLKIDYDNVLQSYQQLFNFASGAFIGKNDHELDEIIKNRIMCALPYKVQCILHNELKDRKDLIKAGGLDEEMTGMVFSTKVQKILDHHGYSNHKRSNQNNQNKVGNNGNNESGYQNPKPNPNYKNQSNKNFKMYLHDQKPIENRSEQNSNTQRHNSNDSKKRFANNFEQRSNKNQNKQRQNKHKTSGNKPKQLTQFTVEELKDGVAVGIDEKIEVLRVADILSDDYPFHTREEYNKHIILFFDNGVKAFKNAIKAPIFDKHQYPDVMVDGLFYRIKTKRFDGKVFYRKGKRNYLAKDCLEYFSQHCFKCGLPDCNPISDKCPMKQQISTFAPCYRCMRGFHQADECKIHPDDLKN